MQGAAICEALNGPNGVPLVHHSERQARVDPLAVDVDGAGAALAVIAAFLGAGQVKIFA